MNMNKRLILDKRYVIEHSLNENMSFKTIGKQILKDCTTVSKEVKSHIVFEKKGAPYKPFNDCLNKLLILMCIFPAFDILYSIFDRKTILLEIKNFHLIEFSSTRWKQVLQSGINF